MHCGTDTVFFSFRHCLLRKLIAESCALCRCCSEYLRYVKSVGVRLTRRHNCGGMSVCSVLYIYSFLVTGEKTFIQGSCDRCRYGRVFAVQQFLNCSLSCSCTIHSLMEGKLVRKLQDTGIKCERELAYVKRDESTWEWRKLHNEELNDL